MLAHEIQGLKDRIHKNTFEQKMDISTTCMILHFKFLLCSLYLFKLGLAPQIQDLLGKVDFTGNKLII